MTVEQRLPATLASKHGGIGVRRLASDPVGRWLAAGWADIKRSPAASLIPGCVCALAGYLVLAVVLIDGISILLFPLIGGFLLIAPWMALEFYEISRRHALNQPVRPLMMIAAVRRNPLRLAAMGALLLFMLFVWIWSAFVVFVVCFGLDPDADLLLAGFYGLSPLFFLVFSNLVGAVLAALAFASCFVGLPMLLDRKAGLATAIATSWRACIANPRIVFGWAVVIVLATALAMLPALLGLIVVFPLLGHATWHAYRDLVVIDPAPHTETPTIRLYL